MTEQSKKRYPKNAPGPFYVADGECIICRAPEHQAPDLMAYDEEDKHCYFKRQPSNPEELDRAIKAVLVACCGAVLYEGNDPAIKRRLAELGQEMVGTASRNPWWKFW